MDKIYYERIKAGFESKSAGKIISTAKQLQKKYISGFEDTIVSILESRYRSNKSWEVQSELIKIIGKERINSALPLIKEIVAKNIDFDVVNKNRNILIPQFGIRNSFTTVPLKWTNSSLN